MKLQRAVRSLSFIFFLLLITGSAFAQIGINVTIAPPALPVYEQPLCPGDGYIWTPGYWAWGDDGYYWVPGTWVVAPEVGYLWTPPWWGWEGGAYIFHAGYWGPHVGFYGGINYGFGYFGTGFVGGRWEGEHFFYNQSVTRINVVNIRNVYNERIVVHNDTHVAFNGGRGGIGARPSAAEEAAARDRHIEAVAAQREHFEAARSNPEFRASVNHGRPAIAATDRPGNFRGGDNHGNANFVHAREVPSEHMERPNTGNAKLDQKYQKQQEKLESRQQKEINNLQKQQDKEHAQLQRQQANNERQQQVEQHHQQQTQQMAQRHTEQRQSLQARQTNTHGAPPREGRH